MCRCADRDLQSINVTDVRHFIFKINSFGYIVVLDYIYSSLVVLCDGGRGSVVRKSEFKSEDLGFDPVLAGQGEAQCVCPSDTTIVQKCQCLTLLRVCPQWGTAD